MKTHYTSQLGTQSVKMTSHSPLSFRHSESFHLMCRWIGGKKQVDINPLGFADRKQKAEITMHYRNEYLWKKTPGIIFTYQEVSFRYTEGYYHLNNVNSSFISHFTKRHNYNDISLGPIKNTKHNQPFVNVFYYELFNEI